MNACSRCGCDFGSVSAFDAHRVGAFGPGEYRGEPCDWTAKKGRRCLDEEELTAKGWAKDSRGRWRQPIRSSKALLSRMYAKSRVEKG